MKMKVINIQEAKTHLSRYIEDVASGSELIIGKAGKPMAKLVPFKAPSKQRALGLLSGKIYEAEDAWSSETDDELAAELEGDDDCEVGKPDQPVPLYKKNRKLGKMMVGESDN